MNIENVSYKLIYFSKLFLGFSLCAFTASQELLAQSASRSWLFKIPLVSFNRESSGALEFNLSNKGTLSLEGNWTVTGEDYTKSEQKLHPGDSLAFGGREFGLMYHRYGNPTTMSGFHWGLGAGFRRNEVNWAKGVANQDESSTNYNVVASGGTASGRLGYRWVGEEIGATLGLFLNLRHFEASIADSKEKGPTQVAITEGDSAKLKSRMATDLIPGLEFGWAF